MDYILFIHGVNTRERRELPGYAQPLRDLIEANNRNSDQKIALKMVPLYWGDVNEDLEDNLLRTYRRSEHWDELSFKDIREMQLLQFTGDAALYISRYAGTCVVDALLRQVIDPQTGMGPGPYSSEDRLHLVTHSWGTVIFFDVLFSGRWDQVGSYQGVNQIRQAIFGLDPSPKDGLRLRSIHTMGSPISVFSLIISMSNAQYPATSANDTGRTGVPNTHDITPGLLDWFERLRYQIPWYNYLHPEDPIAYPLQELIPEMLGNPKFVVKDKLVVKDIVTDSPHKLLNTIAGLGTLGNGSTNQILQRLGGLGGLSQAGQIILYGGNAHQSYWTSRKVAERIFLTIQETMPQPQDSRISPVRNLVERGMKILLRG